jgi:hypothetical protein
MSLHVGDFYISLAAETRHRLGTFSGTSASDGADMGGLVAIDADSDSL